MVSSPSLAKATRGDPFHAFFPCVLKGDNASTLGRMVAPKGKLILVQVRNLDHELCGILSYIPLVTPERFIPNLPRNHAKVHDSVLGSGSTRAP